MTSSARRSSTGGIVKPSALAVLRLMLNLLRCRPASPRNGAGYAAWDYNDEVQSSTIGAHDVHASPVYVNAAAHDFHLQSDSPTLAAGTTDEVPVGELDLEGSPRVKSGNIDIGCYQGK